MAMERGNGRAFALASILWILSPPSVAEVLAQSAGATDSPVAAADYAAPVEGFMQLTGRITVDDDGRVSGYAIDHVDQVSDEARSFLARQIATWRVECDEDVRLLTKAVKFTARLRASPVDDGVYRLWVDGVHLDEPLPSAQRLSVKRKRWPEYPRGMARTGASGTVYMLLLIGADGRTEDVFAEQVDLTAVPPDPADIPRHQLEFIASAAAAARHWRFELPVEGPYARVPQAVRVPFGFFMHGREVRYGEWQYLVRGVRRSPPWSASVLSGLDPVVSGDLQPVRSRLRVVTEPGDG